MPETPTNGDSSLTPPAPNSATGGGLPELPPDDPIYSTGWLILPMRRGQRSTQPPAPSLPPEKVPPQP
jgi:hypothetical protein